MQQSEGSADTQVIERAFQAKRDELGVRSVFPDPVLRAAEEAARRDPAAQGGVDRTALELITIDPPGSMDLDQALCIEGGEGGFRLWYAIADVGFWVDAGGPIEQEAWLRGQTMYAPDRRDTLYPPVLSEGAASLLPDAVKPAILFGFELDGRAEIVSGSVERALVRSRAKLNYGQAFDFARGAATGLEGKSWARSLTLLKTFGEARRQREAERGGVSLPIAPQHVQKQVAARLGYQLEYEHPCLSEEWNAQVSLLTGHAAAQRMIEAKVGMLRVLPPAEDGAIEAFRRAARTLGFSWPQEMSYADFIRSIDLSHPHAAALVWQARRVMKGADYVAFDGEVPKDAEHHALAMVYAHCTAPLRRLGDRYVLDLLVELAAGKQPPSAERQRLPELAKVMNELETRGNRLDRAVIDIAEAWILRDHVGQSFAASVLGIRDGKVEVQLEDPPVRAEAERGTHSRWLDLGASVEVKLTAVDVEAGKTQFAVVD